MHSSRSVDHKFIRKERTKRDDQGRRDRQAARKAKRNWEES